MQKPLNTSSLLGPNIVLSALFSNTLSLCSSLRMRDHVSHPYKTTGKFGFVCFIIYVFLEKRREDRIWTEWQQASRKFYLLFISWWMQLCFVTVVPKYLNFATLSNLLASVNCDNFIHFCDETRPHTWSIRKKLAFRFEHDLTIPISSRNRVESKLDIIQIVCLPMGNFPHNVSKNWSNSDYNTRWLTLCSRVVLVKPFMEPEISSPFRRISPLNPILSHVNPAYILTPCFFEIILILSFHLCWVLFRSDFPTKIADYLA
jgi:hypothetical protein